jgi:hypothetical protein
MTMNRFTPIHVGRVVDAGAVAGPAVAGEAPAARAPPNETARQPAKTHHQATALDESRTPNAEVALTNRLKRTPSSLGA